MRSVDKFGAASTSIGGVAIAIALAALTAKSLRGDHRPNFLALYSFVLGSIAVAAAGITCKAAMSHAIRLQVGDFNDNTNR